MTPTRTLFTMRFHPIRRGLLLLTAVAAIALVGLTNTQAQDPLPSWNDGPAKQAIVDS